MLVKDSFKTEAFGVKVIEEKLHSKEDKQAETILEKTSQRVEDRWETGLLWREATPNLPKSKNMAFKRLEGIERKMDKDSEYAALYCDKIDNYIQKGYVRKLDEEEANFENSKTWYLPHFGVTNPNKPGKFRLVFDAAAKSNGVSLNDALLVGPDLLNSLIGVLLKFRQYKVAFSADISMQTSVAYSSIK